MPPPITGAASGQHMDLSHLVAWDFNLTPGIFPSNGINLGSTLQTTPATNPSGQSWGIVDATGSTGHPLSWSEASPLTTVASSDYFASTAETSITSASDNSHDIDMSDVHGLSLGTARSQPASGLSEAPSSLPYNRTGENNDRDRAHSDLLEPRASSVFGTKDLEKSGVAEDSLPSTYVTLELLDIFFVRYHSFLPCIHRKTLLDRVKQGGASIASNPLIWSILAVAAPGHSDHGVQVLQKKWLARARFLFDRNVCHTMLPTQSLQAAVWVGFQAWISANLTEAWFIVGKACQLANVLRLDQMDSPRSKQLISMTPRPRNAIEVEEQRKAMWSLLCMERSLACLGGFTLSVDERYFQVNYPIDDEAFQVMKSTVSLPVRYPPASGL
ncbi:MAG: hypothetical protein Q9188_002036 [Gyalolechia gomerana]